MNGKEFLADWAYHYAMHLNVFHSKDEDIQKHGDTVIAKGSAITKYVAAPDLEEFEPKAPGHNETIYAVTLNTKENLEALEKHWKKFSAHRNVLVIFLNPKSKLDIKWSIHPYIHNKICDESALHSGLKALFANVDVFKKTDMAALKG